MNDDNTVFVGAKPTMNYVLAVLTQFRVTDEPVALKARGRTISKAVDVAEIVRHRFLPNVKIEDIKIGTENLKDKNGRKSNVSYLEIYMLQHGEMPTEVGKSKKKKEKRERKPKKESKDSKNSKAESKKESKESGEGEAAPE